MGLRNQRLVALVRACGLLPIADRILFYDARIRARASRAEFEKLHGPVPLPPDWLVYEANGAINWQYYWSAGIETAGLISHILRREFPDGSPRRVLEWGCGPGRIVRHMPGMLTGWTVLASDANPESIKWCQESICGVEFSMNQLEPSLPYRDGSLDAVYCVSVFTHLSELMQRAWATEIARVLCARGLLVASFHGDASRPFLSPPEQERYDNGMAVIRGNVREGGRTFVAYHPRQFISSVLSREFDGIEQEPSTVPSLGVHSLYLARKRHG